MNHTIKGIVMLAAITSMLVVGLSMVPVMQNSFAHKKSSEDRQAGGNTNTNTNTNTADSSSSSSATASNTNNITNSATASQSQSQSACAVVVTCPGGTTAANVTLGLIRGGLGGL
jgi:cytoskeletal protein RodZ